MQTLRRSEWTLRKRTQPNFTPRKISKFETYIAIIKAYCSINVLLLPAVFASGGWALSPCAFMVATFFESLCAIRLSMIAMKYKIYSYQLLMEKALGQWGLNVSRVCLAIDHW